MTGYPDLHTAHSHKIVSAIIMVTIGGLGWVAAAMIAVVGVLHLCNGNNRRHRGLNGLGGGT